MYCKQEVQHVIQGAAGSPDRARSAVALLPCVVSDFVVERPFSSLLQDGQTRYASGSSMSRLRSSLLYGSLLFLTTACLGAEAIKEIVAIGDSITDSCQYGAKYIVDKALNSTEVPRLMAWKCQFTSCAVQVSTHSAISKPNWHAGPSWSPLLPRLLFQQRAHICLGGCSSTQYLFDKLW